MLKRVVAHQLAHTYTRTPRVPQTSGGLPVQDPYGEVSMQDATPITGLKCRLDERGPDLAGYFGPEGAGVVESLHLHLAADDPILVGDLVTNVRDRAGRLLADGPLRVASIVERAGHGVAVDRVAELAGAEVA